MSIDGPAIELDEPDTWPADLLSEAASHDTAGRRATRHASDLHFDDQVEVRFRHLLTRRMVRVYHATRLLDHETAAIRSGGLRMLSVELLHHRIAEGYRHGSITAAERDMLSRSHVLASNGAGESYIARRRLNQVCFFLSPMTTMTGDAAGISSLLGLWGGEAIYQSSKAGVLENRLGQLGRPAVVVAEVDLSSERHLVMPGLPHVFTGRLLGLEGVEADVFYRDNVPASQIVAIWQPGDREYDRCHGLPEVGGHGERVE